MLLTTTLFEPKDSLIYYNFKLLRALQDTLARVGTNPAVPQSGTYISTVTKYYFLKPFPIQVKMELIAIKYQRCTAGMPDFATFFNNSL